MGRTKMDDVKQKLMDEINKLRTRLAGSDDLKDRKMNDDPRFEVLPAGEMRKKYGLTAENRPIIKLDPAKVPQPLRHLIPMAERFGISDDLIREDLMAKTPAADVNELRRIVQENQELLEMWLTGPASNERPISAEYVAFTCMMMAADGC
jgi:hypothetical protein